MNQILLLRGSISGVCTCVLLMAIWSSEPHAAESSSRSSSNQHEQMRQRIDAYLTAESANTDKRYVQKGAFSGAIMVAADGEAVLSQAFGYANREWDIRATTDTRFRLWSVTKIFTAVAVLRLQDQDKLKLDDHIDKYLDECPRAWKTVTIRQLLSHTSGLPDSLGVYGPHETGVAGDLSSNRYRTRVTAEEMLEQKKNEPLEFEPGTKFRYNNFGFFVAGLVIEKVTGKRYENALKELIFSPLRMEDTGMDRPEMILSKRADYYQDDPATVPGPDTEQILINAEFYDLPSWMFSAGALYSTIGDLLKFDRALYSGTLLNPATMQQMWSPSSPSGHYGLGWELDTIAGRRCFSHIGAGRGAGMRFMHFPDDRVTIVILANTPGMGAVFTQLPEVVFRDDQERRGK